MLATERGREVFAIAREVMRDVHARLDERLGPSRMAALRGLLEEVGEELR